MAELLVPVTVGALPAAFDVLAVVKGKCDANLNIRINFLYRRFCSLMCLYHYHIAVSISCGDKGMGLRITEYFGVLHSCQLHFLHGIREIKADLNLPLHGITTVFGCICHFCHHLLLKSLHESANLQSHICFIYGADIFNLAAKLLCDISCIACKKLYDLLVVPAALLYKPHR